MSRRWLIPGLLQNCFTTLVQGEYIHFPCIVMGPCGNCVIGDCMTNVRANISSTWIVLCMTRVQCKNGCPHSRNTLIFGYKRLFVFLGDLISDLGQRNDGRSGPVGGCMLPLGTCTSTCSILHVPDAVLSTNTDYDSYMILWTRVQLYTWLYLPGIIHFKTNFLYFKVPTLY